MKFSVITMEDKIFRGILTNKMQKLTLFISHKNLNYITSFRFIRYSFRSLPDFT